MCLTHSGLQGQAVLPPAAHPHMRTPHGQAQGFSRNLSIGQQALRKVGMQPAPSPKCGKLSLNHRCRHYGDASSPLTC